MPRPLSSYPHPAVAIDLALMTVEDGMLKVLLAHRPDAAEVGGDWALPGGFVRIDQGFGDTIERILAEKVGLGPLYVEQLASFGEPGRDPRGRVVAIAYLGLAPAERLRPPGGRDDLVLARLYVPWQGEAGGPAAAIGPEGPLALAFDHAAILGEVVRRLRGKLDYTAVGFELLPGRFTLREVQEVHEAILGRKLTKPSFRRKILDRGWIRPTGEREAGGAFRPAELYERIV